MKKTIFFLVKIFDNEKYASDFIAGKLFANRLSYFRNLEEEHKSNRGDKHEGVVTWLQPHDIHLQINGRTITDLAAPMSISMNWQDDLNVFCIYAAHSGEFETITEQNLSEFKRQLQIPDDCLHLGQYAVAISNVTEFFNRIKTAVSKNNYGLNSGLVDYYDPKKFSGSFIESDAIFKKRIEFIHQKEYRFAFDTGTTGDNPLTLEVGDLSDIAFMCNTSDINRTLEIKL